MEQGPPGGFGSGAEGARLRVGAGRDGTKRAGGGERGRVCELTWAYAGERVNGAGADETPVNSGLR